MNFLKRGPEIKLSDIRVPAFIEDIYLDLKERHLLPVAAILLVAIVAVPFAVAQSSGSPEPGSGEGEASVSSEAGSSSGNLVAQATPGLRKYQRRLDHLQAKDPFKQQYTNEGQGSSEGSSSTGSAGSSTSTETSTGSTESYGGGGETGGGSSTEYESETETRTTHSKLTYYSYAIDVRVTTGAARNEQQAEGEGARQSSAESAQSSAKSGGERHTTVRRKLPELTMLPSRKTPAVIYMGSTKDAKKALLVVSSNVTSIFGDAKCVLGSQTCEMIALEPGLPETFVYGGSGRTFKLELLKIRLVETSKLNRAPLGKPKQNNSKGKQSGKSSG